MRRSGVTGSPDDSYRCTGCGARWSYEAVRYVALCPECASGLVRVVDAESPRPRQRAARSRGKVAPQATAEA